MPNQHYESLSPRILVVDDDEDSRYVTSLLLSRAGYLVDEAADGEEAWEALRATPYDLLLTDHNMPGLCGLDLVARLRAAGMDLPVILHSGWPGFEQGADYSNLRLTAVIPKSSSFTEVQDAVSRLFPSRPQDGLSRQGEVQPTPHSPMINQLMRPIVPAPCNLLLSNLTC